MKNAKSQRKYVHARVKIKRTVSTTSSYSGIEFEIICETRRASKLLNMRFHERDIVYCTLMMTNLKVDSRILKMSSELVRRFIMIEPLSIHNFGTTSQPSNNNVINGTQINHFKNAM